MWQECFRTQFYESHETLSHENAAYMKREQWLKHLAMRWLELQNLSGNNLVTTPLSPYRGWEKPANLLNKPRTARGNPYPSTVVHSAQRIDITSIAFSGSCAPDNDGCAYECS